jgi:hypothetical protein
LGWQCVRATWPTPDGFLGHHSLVRSPNGRLLDVTGWTDAAGLRTRYGLPRKVALALADVDMPIDAAFSTSGEPWHDMARIASVWRALPHEPFGPAMEAAAAALDQLASSLEFGTDAMVPAAMRDVPGIADVARIAEDVREVVDVYIPVWAGNTGYELPEGVPSTTGFCRGAAWAVVEVMRERLPDWDWRPDGGWGNEVGTLADGTLHPLDAAKMLPGSWPGGMSDADGRFQGHFWALGSKDGTEVVVDVTADQFGHGDVVVTSADDPRYRSTFRAEDIGMQFTTAEKSWAAGVTWRMPLPGTAPGV